MILCESRLPGTKPRLPNFAFIEGSRIQGFLEHGSYYYPDCVFDLLFSDTPKLNAKTHQTRCYTPWPQPKA